MPDWVVHIAVAWTLCRILRFRYPQFNPANTALVMAGSVFPDAVKISILFELFGFDWWDYIHVVHLPLGAFLMAGIATLLFEEKKTAMAFLSAGILTHFALDLLLIQLDNGIYLFYPFSWKGFSLNLVPNDDYHITIVALLVALSVYLLSLWDKKRVKRLKR
ncbi:MAG: metal-dependent hydrolase [Euryarchaeota archaeon]|jgi:hypothetical protein|uniref:metal-dependent hydrolase n=1 Tax=Methanobacterium sp. MZD130B TaxID=3394378 RepID=UPI00175C08CB|nr:metal-dependent hydrolase [Euryarchaeota archaeon]HHT18708.1 hypothetical protein [Methanobacterium sp.]